jgi:hypothetical protein
MESASNTNQDTIIDLKLLTAYWCNEATSTKEEEYMWTFEKIREEYENKINDTTRRHLIAFAMSAPAKQNEVYFAAGPLENYINAIVAAKDKDEAYFVTHDPYLKKLLPYVWGDVAKLEPLAKQTTRYTKYSEPVIDFGSQALTAKELAGFWCHACSPVVVEEYEIYYQTVLTKLKDPKLRDKVKVDLLASLPHADMKTYLENNIFGK